MNVISIKVKAAVLKDFEQVQGLNVIANIIDSTLCMDKQYEKLHESKSYKPYVFSNLSPVEGDGIYSKDKVYAFTIRTIDMALAKYLMDCICMVENQYIKCLYSEAWKVKQAYIEKLYTLNPMLIKSDKGYLRNQVSIEEIERMVFENLVKKFKYFDNENNLDDDFNIWNNFLFTNVKPVKIPYKNGITLLGDKVELIIDSNPVAQQVAYMALGVGIGENCSRGCGYVNYHYAR
ncbi:CRISPR-associated endoribonuclease Cas6 [Eubacteriales bacterium KG127]